VGIGQSEPLTPTDPGRSLHEGSLFVGIFAFVLGSGRVQLPYIQGEKRDRQHVGVPDHMTALLLAGRYIFPVPRMRHRALLLLSLIILYCGGEIYDWMPRAYVTSLGRSPLKGFHLLLQRFAGSISHVQFTCQNGTNLQLPRAYSSKVTRSSLHLTIRFIFLKPSPQRLRFDASVEAFHGEGKGPHSVARWEASNLLGGVLLLPGELQTDNEVITLLSHAFDNPTQVLSGKTLAVCEAISSNPEIRVFKLISTRIYDSSKRYRSVPCHSHLTKLCCRFKPSTDFVFREEAFSK